MIYTALATLLSPFYGVGRTLLLIGSKICFVYAALVALMAFGAGKGVENFFLYGRWFLFAYLAKLGVQILDGLVARASLAARRRLAFNRR